MTEFIQHLNIVIFQFVAVHARRGDFVRQCFDVPGDCLAPLSAYAQKIKEIQESLFRDRGLYVSEVLITSGSFLFQKLCP